MSTKNRLIVAAMLGLGAVASFAYVNSPVTVALAADAPAQPTDIVNTAIGAGQFKTLTAALTAAGLVDTLKGPGPFTVFAPTDAAFAKLPDGALSDLLKPENKAKLTAILTYHVVAGKLTAADVQAVSELKTLNGKELPVKVVGGKVMVGDATVTTADVGATNGVIHVIDTVLLP